MRFFLAALIALSIHVQAQTPPPAPSEKERVQKNKDVVRNFYILAFNKHQPAEAMKLYGGSTYKQHNPNAPDGKEAFVNFFTEFFKVRKETSVEIKRMIGEGDYVVVHSHSKLNREDIGSAVIDIFRLENGKLVEHWDVIQQVPKNPANKNTMF